MVCKCSVTIEGASELYLRKYGCEAPKSCKLPQRTTTRAARDWVVCRASNVGPLVQHALTCPETTPEDVIRAFARHAVRNGRGHFAKTGHNQGGSMGITMLRALLKEARKHAPHLTGYLWDKFTQTPNPYNIQYWIWKVRPSDQSAWARLRLADLSNYRLHNSTPHIMRLACQEMRSGTLPKLSDARRSVHSES